MPHVQELGVEQGTASSRFGPGNVTTFYKPTLAARLNYPYNPSLASVSISLNYFQMRFP